MAVKILDVVADRFRIGTVERRAAIEAIEVALKRGQWAHERVPAQG